MKKDLQRKGFTLIEMLVVVAVIAILAAILIPTATAATKKAKAAVDVANLRGAMDVANVALLDEDADFAVQMAGAQSFECATFPGATAYIYYEEPAYINAYFGYSDGYYSLQYFAEIAGTGSTALGTESPDSANLYPIGS